MSSTLLPETFRPIPFYFINTTDPDELSPSAALKAMTKLKKCGFGGAVLFNKPPTGFGKDIFLEKPWFDAIGNFLAAAEKLGLSMWINDGWDYPPGDAAGRIFKRDPELYQRYLTLNEAGEVEVKKADWGFPAFEEPESSKYFIEFVYEEYYRRFKKYFGNTLAGFFSDADNRRINAFTARQIKEKTYFPWSKNFSAAFKERYGYAIEPYLPQILQMADIPQAADYWQFASQLYHNWFKNNFLWCRAHGVKYSFHTSDTGPFTADECRRSSVFSEGETLELAKYCDYPGTDHELLALDGGTHYDSRIFMPQAQYAGKIEQHRRAAFADTSRDIRAKYTASAAVLNNAPRALCEMFAATDWGATPDDLRRIACWQIMQGINFIIPHAVHHRFFGGTKFFAPPEFFNNFTDETLNEFNSFLTKFCMISAQGRYVPEVVIIDPTPEMWRGRDQGKLFEIFDMLNRKNLNFIIAPRKEAEQINCLCIDPLAEQLPELPEPQLTFDGGKIASMIRTMENGEKFALVANVWSDDTLQGMLSFNGREYNIELSPGEIAVVGGAWEEYRSPAKIRKTVPYTGDFQVKWQSENAVVCFHKTLEFEITENLKSLSLWLPEKAAENFQFPVKAEKVRFFDDSYLRIPLPCTAGSYRYELPEADWHTPVRMTGEFDVAVDSQGEFKPFAGEYQLTLSLPEKVKFTLSPRRTTLAAKSWAEQGSPFYSGEAVYSFEIEENFENAVLFLPEYCGSAELLIDGKSTGKAKIFPPFSFHIGALSGKHKFELRLHNTLANLLECYAAPSGLTMPVVFREY